MSSVPLATVSPGVVDGESTIVVLGQVTLEIPNGALDAAADISVTEVSADGGVVTAGIPSAGKGIQVDLNGAVLSAPANVTFQVSPPPVEDALPIGLHLAADGSWELD